MRGGRKRVIGGAVIVRTGSGEALATVVSDGIRVGWTLGKPWNPQQEQMPLQLSGNDRMEMPDGRALRRGRSKGYPVAEIAVGRIHRKPEEQDAEQPRP